MTTQLEPVGPAEVSAEVSAGVSVAAPSAWPVAAFSAAFGVFGAISAARRAHRARRLGLPTGRYWVTFAGTLGVTWLLGTVVAVVVAVVGGGTGPVMDSHLLAQSIVDEGELRDGPGGPAMATGATCADVKVAADGSGTYRCLVDFADGARRAYSVTVDPDGTWVTDSAR